jgi:hypothetical protein
MTAEYTGSPINGSYNFRNEISSSFTLTNDGPFAIYDIAFECGIAQGNASAGPVDAVVIALGSKNTTTKRCSAVAQTDREPPGALLAVRAEYRVALRLFRLHKDWKFALQQAASGYRWVETSAEVPFDFNGSSPGLPVP